MDKNKRLDSLKKAGATAAFLLLFLLLFSMVSDILLDKEYAWYKYRNYAALPNHTVDILYVGNSHFNAAIDAEQVDEAVGNTFGFNYGVSGMRMEYAYYRFQNALRTQSPRLVVLDTFCLVPMNDEESGDNIISWSLDGMPLSWDKVDAVNHLVPYQQRPAYYLPIIKYHARWESLDVEDITSTFDAKPYQQLGRKAETTDRAMDTEDDHFTLDISQEQGMLPLQPEHEQYLKKFINLAKAHGAQVLLLTVPYRQQFGQNSATNGAMLNNTIASLFADDSTVRLLDVNQYYKQLSFTYSDMRDDGHVNISGAEKTSVFVGRYIKENYPALNQNININ